MSRFWNFSRPHLQIFHDQIFHEHILGNARASARFTLESHFLSQNGPFGS
jgi:hypothetical protein